MAILIKKIIFPIILLIAIFLIILHSLNNSQTINQKYTLKAYKNTIALYSGEEIINIYDHIVLNTLPQNDVQNFSKGISFSTTTQAEIYLEDFE